MLILRWSGRRGAEADRAPDPGMAREAQALARMAAGAFLGCNPALDPLAPHAPLRASRRRAEPALRAGLALVDLAAAYAIMSEAPRPATPTPRTKWTRRVPHPVLIGHAASLTPY